jgi:phospholipase C
MSMSAMQSNIKNVVMLMLENRSFDNLFGHLYSRDDQVRIIPQGSMPPYFNGIPPGAYNPAYDWGGTLRNYPVQPIPIDSIKAQGRDPWLIPWSDPTEEFLSFLGTGHGVINQMFGTQNKVSALPPSGTPPQMLGFLQDYWDIETQHPYGGMDILWTFQRDQIPYLYTAALIGSISDAWFSSVPTDTNPNRAFSLCGTSLGRDRNSNIGAVETFDVPTIFNGLASKKSCALYYVDDWQGPQSYTQYTFPQSKDALQEVSSWAKFFERAQAGTLLDFTYLEPKWGGGINADVEMVQGTDLHPPTSVQPGDTVLGLVLSVLTKSPQWPNTLLIITFDEHGGTWDHVGPAWNATPPDNLVSEHGFKFNLFGARVPTILFSPHVPSFTIFRSPAGVPFDHTSVLKTLMGWSGGDLSQFRKRAQAAPDFSFVFSASDEESADQSEKMKAALATAPTELAMPAGNKLFEGIGMASVKWILRTSRTPEEIVRKIEDYRLDPEKFEAALARA